MSLNNASAAATSAPAVAAVFKNYTVDDASSDLTYKGFVSNQEAGSAISFDAMLLFENSISYTMSAQATASFQFTGTAIYIHGICGPEMGPFSVTVDSHPPVSLSAAASTRVYGTLLYAETQLNSQRTHTVIITNVESEKILALDYIILTSDGTAPAIPQSGPTQETKVEGDPGPDSTGAIVGGLVGGLVALLLLWIWYRYRRYKAAGGKGDCGEIFCGLRPKPTPVDPPKPTPWINWPMLSFKPKYDDP